MRITKHTSLPALCRVSHSGGTHRFSKKRWEFSLSVVRTGSCCESWATFRRLVALFGTCGAMLPCRKVSSSPLGFLGLGPTSFSVVSISAGPRKLLARPSVCLWGTTVQSLPKHTGYQNTRKEVRQTSWRVFVVLLSVNPPHFFLIRADVNLSVQMLQ
jgi:hypothetical protein